MEKIKVIGESCFIFSGEKSKIITDPWFGESIYGGSWSQFPSPIISRSDLCNITHIFISHVHADHCCINSIKKIFQFNPKAKIFILNRKDSSCYLQKKLTVTFGPKIKERLKIQDPYKEYKNGDFKTWCMPPEEANSINDLLDSSLVIETEKGLVLFSNDNLPTKPHADFINSLRKKSYLALIPFSGGSGYPVSYFDISESDKFKIAESIRNDYMQKAIKFLNLTNFEYHMPVAGNHIITGKSLNWHNKTSFLLNPYKTLVNSEKFINSSKGIYFEPGNYIQIEKSSTKGCFDIDMAEDFEFRKSLFIESISSRIVIDAKKQAQKLPENKWIEDYFNKLGEKLNQIFKFLKNKDIYKNYNSIFIINCGKISLKAGFEGFSIKTNCEKNFFKNLDIYSNKNWLLINIDQLILFEIYKRSFHINEADAGGLLNYRRNGPYYPDLYTIVFQIF